MFLPQCYGILFIIIIADTYWVLTLFQPLCWVFYVISVNDQNIPQDKYIFIPIYTWEDGHLKILRHMSRVLHVVRRGAGVVWLQSLCFWPLSNNAFWSVLAWCWKKPEWRGFRLSSDLAAPRAAMGSWTGPYWGQIFSQQSLAMQPPYILSWDQE